MKKPNYTQIPNIVIDTHMANLSGSAIKILMAVCRKTIGWHKDTDRISYSQLRSLTGISSNATIRQCIQVLVDAGLIRHERDAGGISVFDLNMDTVSEIDTVTMSEIDTDSINNLHSAMSKTVQTKETLKDTTQKKDTYTSDFENFWKEYPRNANKAGAFKMWKARLKEKVEPDLIMNCLTNYKKKLAIDGTEEKFTLHATTFLNKDHRFEDYAEAVNNNTIQDGEDKLGNVWRDGVKVGHYDGSRYIPNLSQEAKG